MRLEVEILHYSGEETVREIKVLPLEEAIALKTEIDQIDNKVASIAVPSDDVSGYIFNLGENINVVVKSQQVGVYKSSQPVVVASEEELKAAFVYSVTGRYEYDDYDDEIKRWEIEHSCHLLIKLPEGNKPSAGMYSGYFSLVSRSPILDSEIEAAKAEVERLWSFAVDKTLQAKEIFAKLSPAEQEFLRKNLRPGIAPREEY